MPRRIVGAAQGIGDAVGAQDARHPGQRLEVIGAGPHGGQQHHHDIDRLVVDRFEIDRRVQLHEHRHHALERGELAMRHGDAVAEPGRAQRFAIVQRFEDLGGRMSGQRRHSVGKPDENVVLVLDVRANKHGLLGEDVGQFH